MIDIHNSIRYDIGTNSVSRTSTYRYSTPCFGTTQLYLKLMCLKVI